MTTYSDTPYKTLYKRNTNKSIQVWNIYFDGGGYWTVTGKLNGKMIVSSPTAVTPKGKRSLGEQILSEVESKIKKQIDKRYVDDINEVDNAEDNLPGYTAMLANKYEKHKAKIKYPCLVQPKLDGVRCLSKATGFTSRGRKPFTSCQHIWRELEGFFKDNPESRLDGEFYTHTYKHDFERIVSAVKKTAKHATMGDIKLQGLVEYHVYDAPRIGSYVETDSFKDRQELLAKTFEEYTHVVVVPTMIANNEEDIIRFKEQFILEGYEGAIVRNIDSPYEAKRSYNLLKLKDFQDSEFEITGIEEGVGNLAGCVGAFMLINENGDTFKAKLDGSVDRIRYLFTHQEEAVGKMATIRFQGKTAENIPRFPVMKAIRGLKDRSDWV